MEHQQFQEASVDVPHASAYQWSRIRETEKRESKIL